MFYEIRIYKICKLNYLEGSLLTCGMMYPYATRLTMILCRKLLKGRFGVKGNIWILHQQITLGIVAMAMAMAMTMT